MKICPNHSIILFDGVCNLCNGAVNVVIRHDKKCVFKFASLQSEAAQQLLRGHEGLNQLKSIVLIENGIVSQKSTAVLKIITRFSWPWQVLQLFWIMPRFLRDALYDLIAANRYKWFGRKEACMLPGPALRNRFLE